MHSTGKRAGASGSPFARWRRKRPCAIRRAIAIR